MNIKDRLKRIASDAKDKLESTLLIEGVVRILEKLNIRVESSEKGVKNNKGSIRKLKGAIDRKANKDNKNLQYLYNKDIRLDNKINKLADIRLKHGVDGKDGIDGKDGESIKGESGTDGKDGESIRGRDGKDGIDGITKTIQEVTEKKTPLNKNDFRVIAEGLTNKIVMKHKLTTKAIRDYREETIRIARGVQPAETDPVWESEKGDYQKIIKAMETSTEETTIGNVQVHICNSEDNYDLTLPEHLAGKEIKIINSNKGEITLVSTSGTIKGSSTEKLIEGEALILISDGDNWL